MKVSVTKSLNGTCHKRGKQTYVYLAAVYLGNEVNDSVLRIMDCQILCFHLSIQNHRCQGGYLYGAKDHSPLTGPSLSTAVYLFFFSIIR